MSPDSSPDRRSLLSPKSPERSGVLHGGLLALRRERITSLRTVVQDLETRGLHPVVARPLSLLTRSLSGKHAAVLADAPPLLWHVLERLRASLRVGANRALETLAGELVVQLFDAGFRALPIGTEVTLAPTDAGIGVLLPRLGIRISMGRVQSLRKVDEESFEVAAGARTEIICIHGHRQPLAALSLGERGPIVIGERHPMLEPPREEQAERIDAPEGFASAISRAIEHIEGALPDEAAWVRAMAQWVLPMRGRRAIAASIRHFGLVWADLSKLSNTTELAEALVRASAQLRYELARATGGRSGIEERAHAELYALERALDFYWGAERAELELDDLARRYTLRSRRRELLTELREAVGSEIGAQIRSAAPELRERLGQAIERHHRVERDRARAAAAEAVGAPEPPPRMARGTEEMPVEELQPVLGSLRKDVVVLRGAPGYLDNFASWVLRLRRLGPVERARAQEELREIAEQYTREGQLTLARTMGTLCRLGLRRALPRTNASARRAAD